MASSIVLTEVVFTAGSINHETGELDAHYQFTGHKLPNGAVCVSYENTNDAYFESIDAVQACGADVVVDWKETKYQSEITLADFEQSVEGSCREFGADAVPESVHDFLLKQKITQASVVVKFSLGLNTYRFRQQQNNVWLAQMYGGGNFISLGDVTCDSIEPIDLLKALTRAEKTWREQIDQKF